MQKTNYKKLLQSFRAWISGLAETDKNYFRVLKALNLGEKYHKGLRKDGNHEFSHQVSILSYLKTLHKSFIDPVAVFIVAILHDTIEDYPESAEEVRRLFPDEYEMVVTMSKIRDGEKIPYEEYFSAMSKCPVCSIVKLVDRMSNISTMLSVFNLKKQDGYLEDLDIWFFPMLKKAKRLFPEQESAYENIKSVLFLEQTLIQNARLTPN